MYTSDDAVIVADSSKNPVNVTFLNPKVRMLGDDAAVITYYRIVQSLNRCVLNCWPLCVHVV